MPNRNTQRNSESSGRSRRGFASMDPQERRRIARKGGQASARRSSYSSDYDDSDYFDYSGNNYDDRYESQNRRSSRGYRDEEQDSRGYAPHANASQRFSEDRYGDYDRGYSGSRYNDNVGDRYSTGSSSRRGGFDSQYDDNYDRGYSRYERSGRYDEDNYGDRYSRYGGGSSRFDQSDSRYNDDNYGDRYSQYDGDNEAPLGSMTRGRSQYEGMRMGRRSGSNRFGDEENTYDQNYEFDSDDDHDDYTEPMRVGRESSRSRRSRYSS